jgi:hypothetical protein
VPKRKKRHKQHGREALPAERIAEILDRCWNLEAQTDIGALLRLFVSA